MSLPGVLEAPIPFPIPPVAAPPTPGGLSATAAELRAEWRADEDLWTREAARRWTQGRRLTDLLREYAARGDRVSIDVAGCTFVGDVGDVGDDRVDVLTPSGTVTIHLALTGGFGAVATPLVLRRAVRARAGGRRLPAALTTFTARLRALAEAGGAVRVGTFIAVRELVGPIEVGADHVLVRGHDDVVVPLAWVAYVVATGEGAS